MKLTFKRFMEKNRKGLKFYSLLLALSLSTNLGCIAQDEFSGTLIAKSSKEKKQKDKDDSSSEQAADDDNKPAEAAKTEIEAAESADKPVSFSGNASWYGIPFHGKKTASGEIFDMYKCSAAHLHLPLPTKCLVEDPRTGNAVIVKVNDRGPYVKTRVMDLSREAARELGTLPRGVAYIDVTVLESKHKPKSKS